jgi:hypothetical protein
MMLYQFISGDFPLTITFLIVLAVWASGHRSTVREFWNESSPFWRLIGRTTLVLAVVLPLWIALFDNWRQLLGYSLGASSRYKSDIFITTATSEPLRWISLAMIAISLVCLALIYSRRRHGLGMLSLMLVFALAYFYFFNGVRMRADTFLATTQEDLDHPTTANVIFIVVWAIGMYGFIASVIAAAYVWLFSVIAFPLHIIYGFATRNRIDADPETLLVYRVLQTPRPEQTRQNHASDREDSPPVDSKRAAS